MIKMNKWDSLVFLKERGLNTPNSILFLSPNLKEEERGFSSNLLEEELKLVIAKMSSSENRVSIRTFKLPLETSFKEVFLPNVLVDPILISRLISLHNEWYFLIISSPIDPKDCLFRGCIQYKGKNFFERSRFLIEYLEGPGTVRDLENADMEQIKRLEVGFLPGDWTFLKEVLCSTGFLLLGNAERIVSSLDSNLEFVLEWSLYKKPVGVKKEHLIFWHLRE